MRLSDVWRNLSEEISVFWKDTFKAVPPVPGVYAWFYPLRVKSKDLAAVIEDFDRAFRFDALSMGKPTREVDVSFGWSRLDMQLALLSRRLAPSESIAETWDQITRDSTRFWEVRRALLKASILMPPLYVGKTTNLYARCWQHINGTSGGDFNDRFESYAAKANLAAASVEDLILACIRTTTPTLSDANARSEAVIEEVLKLVAQPPYGKR